MNFSNFPHSQLQKLPDKFDDVAPVKLNIANHSFVVFA
jgi:hypothetical protein